MTTGIADPSPADRPAETATKNPFQRIAGVLFAPAETFQEIARRPDVLVPLLLIAALAYIGTAITLPRIDWDAAVAAQAEQIRASQPNLSDADIERTSRLVQAVGKVTAWISPLLQIAWFAIVAGVLLLAFRLMGGDGGYKQAFSATLYAWMPLVINGIILAVVALARGSVNPMEMATLVKSNPAFLVEMKEQPVLFALLAALDVFTIWTVVLLIFGFAALARTSKAKAAAIVISLWVLLIVVRVGFAALAAARMQT